LQNLTAFGRLMGHFSRDVHNQTCDCADRDSEQRTWERVIERHPNRADVAEEESPFRRVVSQFT
jgi:hypothetical protein